MVAFLSNIGVIGAGSLGEAVIEAIYGRTEGEIFATRRSKKELQKIKQKYPLVQTATSNSYAVERSDVIILAVKPKVIEEVSGEIGQYAKDKLVISLAAAKSISQIEKALGNEARVCRVLTGLFVAEEIAAYSPGEKSTAEDVQKIKYIFGNDAKEVEEDILAHRTYIGCDTGLLAKEIEEKIQELVEMGMGTEDARAFYSAMMHAVANRIGSGESGHAISSRVGGEGSFTRKLDLYLDERSVYESMRECVRRTVNACLGKDPK